MSKQEKAFTKLKDFGYKLTKPRKAILEVMLSEHGPFSVEEIFHKMNESCDMVTIYRNMAVFIKSDLVSTCDFGDGLTRYEFRSHHHHHHHIICKDCRQAETLEYCFLKEVERMIQDKGYTDVDHHLEFYALCRNCQT